MMPLSYLFQVRKALNKVVVELDEVTEKQKQQVFDQFYLKKPKNSTWGDLCTNLYILLKSREYISENECNDVVLQGLRRLEYVEGVDLSENGHINLVFDQNLWKKNLEIIVQQGIKFGLEKDCWEKLPVSIVDPPEIIDLESARQQVNAHGLRELANLAGWNAKPCQLRKRPARGYSLDTANAKCTESITRFSLIANPPAFAETFSPILAVDKSYGNPVFCIPYARWYLRKLINNTVLYDEMALDISLLSLPIELKLAKLLSEWPLVVEKTRRKGDVFHLIAFLHDVSLLFFSLVEEKRPISSEYLRNEITQRARLLLIQATMTILDQGSNILGLQSIEEFNP
jgi:arginyl-tRNA synthetase